MLHTRSRSVSRSRHCSNDSSSDSSGGSRGIGGGTNLSPSAAVRRSSSSVAATRSRYRSHSTIQLEANRQRRIASSSKLEEMEALAASSYKLVIMGAAQVGKTAIVNQFLYDNFLSEYEETVEEMYRAEYEVGLNNVSTTDSPPGPGVISVNLDILDTSGSYSFPAMRKLSIAHADGFVLVYSIDNKETFDEVKNIRDQILEEKSYIENHSIPIVIVGNKADLENESKREVDKSLAEMTVCVEWGHGFVECSAKNNESILEIFKELLIQKKLAEPSSPVVRKSCDLSPTQLKQLKYDNVAPNKVTNNSGAKLSSATRRVKFQKKQDSCVVS